MDESSQSSVEHLAVLVHGLWGNPNHLNYLRDTLQEQQTDGRLYIFQPKSNADSFTYDGIEVGAERITNEVEQKIKGAFMTLAKRLDCLTISSCSSREKVANWSYLVPTRKGTADCVRELTTA